MRKIAFIILLALLLTGCGKNSKEHEVSDNINDSDNILYELKPVENSESVVDDNVGDLIDDTSGMMNDSNGSSIGYATASDVLNDIGSWLSQTDSHVYDHEVKTTINFIESQDVVETLESAPYQVAENINLLGISIDIPIDYTNMEIGINDNDISLKVYDNDSDSDLGVGVSIWVMQRDKFHYTDIGIATYGDAVRGDIKWDYDWYWCRAYSVVTGKSGREYDVYVCVDGGFTSESDMYKNNIAEEDVSLAHEVIESISIDLNEYMYDMLQNYISN